MSDKAYERELRHLQIRLVRYQLAAIEAGRKDLVIFEGRDTAGKDGTIKRIIEHLSVRATRVVALPKPSDRERSQWYFQRYVQHLPAAGELVIFNRSWYNRGGVEPVMGFCTPAEHETFLRDVVPFEEMLVENGVRIVKLWLDVSKAEQAARLKDRRTDPLKTLKISPLDAVAQEKWDAYSGARDEMLIRSNSRAAPWTIVRADSKVAARLAIMRFILHRLASGSATEGVDAPDPDTTFSFDAAALQDGRLER